MSLDFDHPVHQWLLRVSETLGRPWPPDAWLGSVTRLRFLNWLHEQDYAAFVAKAEEANRLALEYERVRDEAAEILDQMSKTEAAILHVSEDQKRERAASPWCADNQYRPERRRRAR